MASPPCVPTHALEHVDIDALTPYAGNARTHSKQQIGQIAKSIARFGFVNPVLIGEDGGIIAGHGRVAAARTLGIDRVPVIRLAHLSATERRAYVLADNKLALNAGWDREMLAIELQGLIELGIDCEITGFSVVEIDDLLIAADDARPSRREAREDAVPEVAKTAVTRMGDLWQLGRHRLLCGDAREEQAYAALLAGEQVDLVFTDPPYNVAIDGHVCGLGRTRHREFAFASGEMDRAAFQTFLAQSLGGMARAMRDGALAFVCMDWRHVADLIAVGEALFDVFKNLIVWNKSNGGMGAFYRSKHELICVFKKGTAPHTNSFGLGDGGRYRTNVWDYPGISSMSASRQEELAMHPTVKPVALVADALRDCSRRGDIILDGFAGSGTTLIAAEKTGRTARLVEYDPLYCDTIVRRWQRYSGKAAIHVGEGVAFEALADARCATGAA